MDVEKLLNDPTPYLTASTLFLASALYLFTEKLAALNFGHLGATLFYAGTGVMVVHTLYFRLKNQIEFELQVSTDMFLWYATGLLGSRIAVRGAEIGNPESVTGSLGFIPISQIWIGGYHLHHYIFGVTLLIIAGIILVEKPDFSRLKAASIIGLGLGLTMDESGFLITMGDYSSPLTYPIALIVGLLLYLNILRQYRELN